MILHIFKKDARRLWPHIAVTLAVLGALAWHDRWRSDWMPGSTEGWLNLLMPLAWAFLIGLAMEQEPLVGDREFWITRPYRRTALLAAKALFVLLFIHVPYFVASSYILRARGFPPTLHLPELLWNQLLLAGALTLPAMALASLVRNFTHFVLEVVVVVAAAIFLSGTSPSFYPYGQPVDVVRQNLAILVAGAAACLLLWMQYTRGRVLISRTIGVAAGLLAAFVISYLMPQTAFGLRSAMKPADAEMALRISPRDEKPGPHLTSGAANRPTFLMPVELSGVPAGAGYHFYPLRTEIVTPGGERFRSATTADYRSSKKIVLESHIVGGADEGSGREWLLLRVDPALYQRLKAEKVGITGDVAVVLYRLGETVWMPPGDTRHAAEAGRCTSIVVEGRQNQLKVECESPAEIPVTRVRLWHPETGEEWKSRVGEFSTFATGPRTTWLSPLVRRQTVFTLTDDARRLPGSRWVVPAAYLSSARLAITPEEVTGYSVLHFDFPEVSLDAYRVFSPR